MPCLYGKTFEKKIELLIEKNSLFKYIVSAVLNITIDPHFYSRV